MCRREETRNGRRSIVEAVCVRDGQFVVFARDLRVGHKKNSLSRSAIERAYFRNEVPQLASYGRRITSGYSHKVLRHRLESRAPLY